MLQNNSSKPQNILMTQWKDYANNNDAPKNEPKKPNIPLTAQQIEDLKMMLELQYLKLKIKTRNEEIDRYKAECLDMVEEEREMAEQEKRMAERERKMMELFNEQIPTFDTLTAENNLQNDFFNFYKGNTNSQKIATELNQPNMGMNAQFMAPNHHLLQNQGQFGIRSEAPISLGYQRTRLYPQHQFQHNSTGISQVTPHYRKQNNWGQEEGQRGFNRS